MIKTVLSIDPGVTSGIAIHDRTGYTTSTTTDKKNLFMFLGQLPTESVVIYERFATAGRLSKYGLLTIELVGAIEALCWAYSLQAVRQTPAQRRVFLPAANIKLDGLRATPHEKDALAHLLYWEHENNIK